MATSNTQPLEFEKPIVELETEIANLKNRSKSSEVNLDAEIGKMQAKLDKTLARIHRKLTPWQRVQICRHPARPFFLDYVEQLFTDFIELHGDRHIGDDHAMPVGLANFGGRRVVIIGHQKGRDTKERTDRNFGMANPEGYRKALRIMRLAEKFNLPIITFIDTPGAYPGVGAEERNIAEAIAFNLREMFDIHTPILAVIIGEGGSGGALGIGIADRVLMLENSYYSVISPEGCAAILWKDRKHAPEAAEALKITAADLLKFGIIDAVVPETKGGAHRDPDETAENLRVAIASHLDEIVAIDRDELLNKRYERFRSFGNDE